MDARRLRTTASGIATIVGLWVLIAPATWSVPHLLTLVDLTAAMAVGFAGLHLSFSVWSYRPADARALAVVAGGGSVVALAPLWFPVGTGNWVAHAVPGAVAVFAALLLALSGSERPALSDAVELPDSVPGVDSESDGSTA